MKKKQKKHSILIVEDELPLRSALCSTLKKTFEDEGVSVYEAKNGEEGLEVASRVQPNVILLDIVMPKMDGMTMLGKLRECDWGKKTNVIILSNLSAIQNVANATSFASYDYLVKSDWKLEEIVEQIRSRLKKSLPVEVR